MEKMTEQSDHTIRHWRELADQLTAEQIAILERAEECNSSDEDLIDDARKYANINLGGRIHFGHLDTPEGAVKVHPCHQDHNVDGAWIRPFTGTRHTVGGVNATIEGIQCPDGSVFRTVAVTVDDFAQMPAGQLTADQTRELGALLTILADELDRLNGH